MDIAIPTAAVVYDAARRPSALSHLVEARRAEWRLDWAGSAQAATAAIDEDPSLVAAYLVRALARRLTGDLLGAIADYSRVVGNEAVAEGLADDGLVDVGLDPGCAIAWEFRGATRSSLAASLTDTGCRLALLAAAEQDYQRSIRMDPGSERLRLALIETALTSDRPTVALAYAGEAWGNLRTAEGRLIAAWLGSLAAVAAGRPRCTWQAYRRALRARDVPLGELDWSLVEVNGWLRRLNPLLAVGGVPVLAALLIVHQQFLSHFVKEGPLLH